MPLGAICFEVLILHLKKNNAIVSWPSELREFLLDEVVGFQKKTEQ
jgi:hypothetical protein